MFPLPVVCAWAYLGYSVHTRERPTSRSVLEWTKAVSPEPTTLSSELAETRTGQQQYSTIAESTLYGANNTT